MGNNRLQKNNRLTRGLLLGAITVGALAVPVAPAIAQPLTIPGVGGFEVPGMPPAGSIAPEAVVTHGQRAVDAAQTKIGAPYVWGATGPDTFDCSGLVQWAYRQAGVSVPRTTYDQVKGGSAVGKGDLQPGDVVLFNGAEHVGLYAGGGMVVHASTSGQPVKKAPLDSMPFFAARRY
ncbi:C40 family peptidase [Rhodococcus sp. NPDC058514]|uniref:C40 family peptidase n=1 Tax=unclassified Rhodococcus (in: high G+C Gram-positive bacteria) TaxID=192944 RepID=UPI003651348A